MNRVSGARGTTTKGYICVAGVPEGKEKDCGTEKIFWGNNWKLCKFGERYKLTIEGAGLIPPRINWKKSTPRRFKIKLLETTNKEKTLKAAREKLCITYRRTTIWMTGPLFRNRRGQKEVLVIQHFFEHWRKRTVNSDFHT